MELFKIFLENDDRNWAFVEIQNRLMSLCLNMILQICGNRNTAQEIEVLTWIEEILGVKLDDKP